MRSRGRRRQFSANHRRAEENTTKQYYELSSRKRREMFIPRMQCEDTVSSKWHQTDST